MFRKLFLAVLLIGFGSATPVAAKDAWKHYYKEQEKRAKVYDKYQRKQAKEYYKFCRKNGC